MEITRPVEAADTRSDLARDARLVVAGELVAAITHDLRQPLTAIEMNVGAALRRLDKILLGQSPGDLIQPLQAAADALRGALDEQRRMREALQVLQDLVARREPSFAPVDLAESVREVVRLVGSDGFAKRIRVDIDAPDDLPRVAADATLVRQAFLNILLDAFEATPDSTQADAPVVVAARADASGAVDVAVTHFGVHAKSGGEWGLALARSVADVHGGSLRVSGDAEQGLTVTTRWPVVNDADAHNLREDARAGD